MIGRRVSASTAGRSHAARPRFEPFIGVVCCGLCNMEAVSLLTLFRFVIFWGEHAVVGPYFTMTQIDDAFAVQTANASSI